MATGKLAETVAVELEQAAGDLEKVASVARRIDGRAIGFLGIGLGVGAVAGFYIGYKYSKSKLRNEIYAEAEEDVETIRNLYQQKIKASQNLDKDSVENIVQKKGYASEEEGPFDNESPSEVDYSRLDDPTEVPEPQSIRANVFEDNRSPVFRMPTAEKEKDDNWNWDTENVRRKYAELKKPPNPYILHQDEFETNESGFAQAAYVYYVTDDILVDEEDPKTELMNRENLIGLEAQNKFGHGADDYNTVYVRNPTLELEFAIYRVMGSWEEEVLGLDPHESG